MNLLTTKNGRTDDSLKTRIIDPNELDRAERNAANWRLAFFVMSALFVLSMIDNAVLAGTERTRAIVYFATPDEIKYVGDTNQVFTPTLLQEEKAVGDFIKALRHVPKDDPTMADEDALTVEAYVNPEGYREWTTGLSLENPKTLAARGYGREVIGQPTVSRINDLSFQVQWTERIMQPGQLTTTTPINVNASGTVTLAGQPAPPTVVDVAKRNPVGISIKSYDLKAPVLGAQP